MVEVVAVVKPRSPTTPVSLFWQLLHFLQSVMPKRNVQGSHQAGNNSTSVGVGDVRIGTLVLFFHVCPLVWSTRVLRGILVPGISRDRTSYFLFKVR